MQHITLCKVPTKARHIYEPTSNTAEFKVWMHTFEILICAGDVYQWKKTKQTKGFMVHEIEH